MRPPLKKKNNNSHAQRMGLELVEIKGKQSKQV